MRKSAMKSALRHRRFKNREIEIFLNDLENERMKDPIIEQPEGLGVGRYPPDYLQGIWEEEAEMTGLMNAIKEERFGNREFIFWLLRKRRYALS